MIAVLQLLVYLLFTVFSPYILFKAWYLFNKARWSLFFKLFPEKKQGYYVYDNKESFVVLPGATIDPGKSASNYSSIVERELGRVFNTEQFVQCPECSIDGIVIVFSNILPAVVHLNDSHLWKREKIAEFLERQELDLAAKTD